MKIPAIFEARYDRIVEQYVNSENEYSYEKFLGYGAYGRTYLLKNRKTSERYVLKLLRSKHRFHKKTREKFEREMIVLNELHYSFIPKVIEVGEIRRLPFIIMEFVEGQTLEQLIFEEGRIFSLPQSLEITKQLLQHVMVLHEANIIHRDLRIPNVLLQHDKLFLIDFGLAEYKKEVKIETIKNPKKAQNHISDLYFVGHFLLFLLYSAYTPTEKKEQSWQQELLLPFEVKLFIERLLMIEEPFSSAEEAIVLLERLINRIVK